MSIKKRLRGWYNVAKMEAAMRTWFVLAWAVLNAEIVCKGRKRELAWYGYLVDSYMHGKCGDVVEDECNCCYWLARQKRGEFDG
jgi:hypothetical protein